MSFPEVKDSLQGALVSLNTEINRADYDGNGSTATFPYPFKIFTESELVVIETDDAGVETILGLNADYLVTGVTIPGGSSQSGGNVIRVAGNLPVDFKWTILRVRALRQDTSIRNQGEYFPSVIEDTFDKLVMIMQQLNEIVGRCLKLPRSGPSDFDPTLPTKIEENALKLLMVSDTGLSVTLGPTEDDIITAAVAAAAGAGGSFDETDYAYSGFSARFGALFDSTELDDTLRQIINLQYAAPGVSLSASGSGTVREKGTAVTSTNLAATVTKKSDPIAAVRFYKDGTLVNTVAIPNPAGGVETYTWSGSFSDNVLFSTQVDDNGATGGPTTVSASAGFIFVYPYYYGAGVAGKTAAQVAALTKDVVTVNLNKTVVFTASTSNVFYYAYIAGYGDLTSILDVNNFETIGDWTKTTANITGLDGNAVSYNIYAFNNPVVAGTYQYTFKR